jgi:hypothetical protein
MGCARAMDFLPTLPTSPLDLLATIIRRIDIRSIYIHILTVKDTVPMMFFPSPDSQNRIFEDTGNT